VLTIEDQIAKLRSTVRTRAHFPFNAMLSETTSRVELSVTLLAVLELIKRQELLAEQEALFGAIEIKRNEAGPITADDD
jgi:chromatin segregation and condensation protein Rec8/ScpA/Scc1 (kleisin family)